MWVRSQDRTVLIEVKNKIAIIKTFEGHAIEIDNVRVGTYENKECAIELVDNIQNQMVKEPIGKHNATLLPKTKNPKIIK